VNHRLGSGLDAPANSWGSIEFKAMQDDAAADPEHGGCAEDAEECQEGGHTANKHASERAARTGDGRSAVVLCKSQAEIVGFDDQSYHAYTAAVIPSATTANTAACIEMLPTGTAASVIAMISAERMKSVLMALPTFSSSIDCAFDITVRK
jgi:hypothetical protein